MAAVIGDDLALDTLDAIFGSTTLGPASVYFALMSAAPTGSGGGTEFTGGTYARVSKTNNSTTFPAASLVTSVATKKNGVLIDWSTLTGHVGTITVIGVAIYDASTSGNLLAYAPVGTSRAVISGDSFSVAINALSFTLTGA